MGNLVRLAGHKAILQVRYIAPVAPSAAVGQVAEIYRQVERDFGMLAPPVALHSPAPGPLAASWVMLRETLLAGLADRPAKEAVAATVSFGNACPYCVQVHTSLLHGLVRSSDAVAIETGQIDAVTDPRIRGLAAWARSGPGAQAGGLRGPSDEDGGRVGREPFPAAQRAEFIGVAVTFHYLNRMVNVFLGDPPLPRSMPAALRGGAMRMAGSMLRPVTRKPLSAGTSLDLLPEAALPSDLSWASPSEIIGSAFARAAAAIDVAAADVLPPAARELVLSKVASWNGRPPAQGRLPADGRLPPLGRAWVDEVVSVLADEQRPAARLALLTAVASYQIRPDDIDQARRHDLDDAALVGLTAWASLAAARYAGQLLAGHRQAA